VIHKILRSFSLIFAAVQVFISFLFRAVSATALDILRLLSYASGLNTSSLILFSLFSYTLN